MTHDVRVQRDNQPGVWDDDAEQNTISPLLSLDPEALYKAGMASYRLRHWREAKEYFVRLRELDPARRGIDDLLREIEIFIQLKTVGGEPQPETSSAETLTSAPSERLADYPAQPRRLWLWGLWFAAIVLIIVTVAGVVAYSRGLLPFLPSDLFVPKEQRVTNLRNLGQAYLVAQQYCKALKAYAELVKLTPADPEALNGLDKAKSKLYDEALAYLKAGNVAKAQENWQCVCAVDAAYKDACTRVAGLARRQELDQLYQQARGYLDTQVYAKAVELLLKIRTLDADYNPGTVSDALYEAYLGQARQMLESLAPALVPASSAKANEPKFAATITAELLGKVRQVVRTFDKALAERPTSEPAMVERALADHLNQGLERYSDWAWAESVAQLNAIYKADPAYLMGRVVPILCDARLYLADEHYKKGDYRAALNEYQVALALKECNPVAAQTRAHEIGVRLTPSPMPTFTPLATATNTPRPIPTATPVPPASPTPSPTAVPTSASSGGGGGSSPPPPPPPPTSPPLPPGR